MQFFGFVRLLCDGQLMPALWAEHFGKKWIVKNLTICYRFVIIL